MDGFITFEELFPEIAALAMSVPEGPTAMALTPPNDPLVDADQAAGYYMGACVIV